MTDTETAAAIDALTYRLRVRDAAMRDGEDHADAEVFAAEFFAAMRGRGWRHTAAPAQDQAGSTERSETVRAELDAARQRMEAASAAIRAEREAGAA